jgi:hypothetical protein
MLRCLRAVLRAWWRDRWRLVRWPDVDDELLAEPQQ